MSTRATYEFTDEYDNFTVYKHHDGYPEGAYEWISKALPHAWDLPRFEASEFAAAFCAGNCGKGGGGVRLTKGRDAHGDTQYHYVIRLVSGQLQVERHVPNGYSDGRQWTLEESGTLQDMLAKHCPSVVA